MKDARVRSTIESGGGEIVASGAEEFRAVIAADLARYAGLKDVFKEK
jgi:hypothetical protein